MQTIDAKQRFNILSTAAADLGELARDLGRPVQKAADTLQQRAAALSDVIELADKEGREALTKAECKAVIDRDPVDVETYTAALATVRAAEIADDESRERLVNALVAVGAK